MSVCLHFLMRVNEESFEHACMAVFGVLPFEDKETSDEDFVRWRIPYPSRPWRVDLFENAAFISSDMDWDFIWEKDYLEECLVELEKFQKVFGASDAYLLPETLCQDILYQLSIDSRSELADFLQEILGPPCVLSKDSLQETEEKGLERRVYFVHRTGDSP